MPGDWLADRRTDLAADRILDAAGQLFAERDAATVGMNDIARAAGCSRATLYRYFENREALHTSYVHREAQRLYRQLSREVGGLDDPGERLVEGVLTAVQAVRDSPALASWFTTAQRPIGGQMAEQSEVVRVLVESFVRALGVADGGDVERRSRWVVRVLTSLLLFPGNDAADERAMLTEFLAPTVVPGRRVPIRRAPTLR